MPFLYDGKPTYRSKKTLYLANLILSDPLNKHFAFCPHYIRLDWARSLCSSEQKTDSLELEVEVAIWDSYAIELTGKEGVTVLAGDIGSEFQEKLVCYYTMEVKLLCLKSSRSCRVLLIH